MKISHFFRAVTVAEERAFERELILGKRERYLAADPRLRYQRDAVYAEKVDRARAGIADRSGKPPAGWVLDIGGNTGGEATLLCQDGTKVIVADINEAALEISRARARKFEFTEPGYVAMDVHKIPFADASMDVVMVLEALHHFPDYDVALAEIQRVLKPGGLFYSQEPNGLNPLRRLSEVRDRLRGTVEKSFFRSQLLRLMGKAGFERLVVRPGVCGRSDWKIAEVPGYRRWLAVLHGRLQIQFPRFFGPHEIFGFKPGDASEVVAEGDWRGLLREPGGGAELDFDAQNGRWQVRGTALSYPDLDGIPVLIEADGKS